MRDRDELGPDPDGDASAASLITCCRQQVSVAAGTPASRRPSASASVSRSRSRTRPDQRKAAAAPEELAATIAERSQAKYGWGSVEQYRADVCAFVPGRAVTWTGMFETATPLHVSDLG